MDVDKVEVRFYERDSNGQQIWTELATDIYVHYQVGIALKTPPYRNVNIKENVSEQFGILIRELIAIHILYNNSDI